MALTDCHANAMAWVRMLPGRPAPPQLGRTLLKGTLIRLRRERRYLVMPVCSGRVIKARRATTNLSVKPRRLVLSIRANNEPEKPLFSGDHPAMPETIYQISLALTLVL